MGESDRILIVEDDEDTRSLVQDYLGENGCETQGAGNSDQMWEILQSWEPDVIVMDIMLPGEDGLSLCKRLTIEPKTLHIPVIMLTARGDEMDRVIGLEMGADDYLPKPFSSRELLARIKSVLRRSRAAPRERHPEEITRMIFADWTLHIKAQRLTSPDGVMVDLTKGEFVLLQAFLQHPNEILDRDRIMEIYRMREATIYDRSIDVQVGRIRKRLKEDPKQPKILKTVWGKGYMLSVPVEEV
ncbi:MAG: response regulator [Magnetococcales bacterium]|nr:response regulator [Magnetococcales bacterium]